MFQTITGKPFCPIAAIAAPENFCCAGKLFGGLVSQTRTPPECAIQREVRAGSREPSWCGRYEGLCYEGSVSQTHGRGKGSSRNSAADDRRITEAEFVLVVAWWTIVSPGRTIVGRRTIVSSGRTIVSRGLSVEPRAWCAAKAVA